MLAALLLNIPQFSQHGEAKPRATSTSWNPRWSEMYGPDAQRLKNDKKAVKRAIEEIRLADFVPAEFEGVKEFVHSRSLVDELENYKPDTEAAFVYVLEAWLSFCAWRKSDDEAIAVALLMMD